VTIETNHEKSKNKSKKLEIEVKLKIDSIEKTREKILGLDFRGVVSYSFEHNIVFDTPDGQLKQKGILLRLRKGLNKNTLTLKRPPGPGKESTDYKIKEEIETDVSDFENTREIIRGLGYDIFFIYEKYREIFKSSDGRVIVTIDHTPIGDYMEIEADVEEIDRIAVALGYTKKDYITGSYYTLFLEHKKTGHMIF
jgi:adenylate cyclase, class 2